MLVFKVLYFANRGAGCRKRSWSAEAKNRNSVFGRKHTFSSNFRSCGGPHLDDRSSALSSVGQPHLFNSDLLDTMPSRQSAGASIPTTASGQEESSLRSGEPAVRDEAIKRPAEGACVPRRTLSAQSGHWPASYGLWIIPWYSSALTFNRRGRSVRWWTPRCSPIWMAISRSLCFRTNSQDSSSLVLRRVPRNSWERSPSFTRCCARSLQSSLRRASSGVVSIPTRWLHSARSYSRSTSRFISRTFEENPILRIVFSEILNEILTKFLWVWKLFLN